MIPHVSPLDHHPDRVHRRCRYCGDLTDNPTRCPGWLAHRTEARYHAEGWENGEWTGTVGPKDTLAEAVVQHEHKMRRFPDMQQRLMAAITLYFPVAAPTAPGEQIQQLLDGSYDTVALLTRSFGQERDRALAAEARVRELEAELEQARATRAETHRRSERLIRIIARNLYADAGIRVLAALDTRADDHELERLRPLIPDGEPSESTEYQVVGGWGVDGARDAEDARANVRRSLAAYPDCGARAKKRTVLTWDDDTQLYGPWEPLDPDGDEAR